MASKLSFALFALSVFSLAYGRCPRPVDLPVVWHLSTGYDKFYCARIYTENHLNPALSCTGQMGNVINGDNAPSLTSTYARKIRAIVVRPGCSFLAYTRHNYLGKSKAFTGSNPYLKKCGTDNYSKRLCPWVAFREIRGYWGDSINSGSCFCEFNNDALKCTPREEFQVLHQCRNDLNTTMLCTHSISKGMDLGHSVTNGKSMSTTLTVSISAAIGKIFSLGLSESTTTSYDWSKTDSKTFHKLTRTTVTCHVPPGKTLTISQVTGRCGDTAVYTGYYKCSAE